MSVSPTALGRTDPHLIVDAGDGEKKVALESPPRAAAEAIGGGAAASADSLIFLLQRLLFSLAGAPFSEEK